MFRITLFITAITFLFACSKPVDRAALETKLQNLGTSLMEGAIANAPLKADSIAQEILAAVKSSPKDTSNIHFLIDGGNLCKALRGPNQAITLWDKYLEMYPNHWRNPQAYFLKAFTLDADLRDIPKAKEAYREFIQKFPNNPNVAIAQQALQAVDKSPEEIIQSAQSQMKDSSLVK
jgi:tetratricopeptide (TPR) repeat protein